MKIIGAYPPNFSNIVAAFPSARRHGVVFTFGDTIFNPSGVQISPWITAHETVHSGRQEGNPAAWWEKYITDKKFRFDEELIAHRVEWLAWMRLGNRNRHDKRAMMKHIAGRLSGPLYGNMVSIETARTLIMAGETR